MNLLIVSFVRIVFGVKHKSCKVGEGTEMLSSGPDIITTNRTSQQLWLLRLGLHKTGLGNSQSHPRMEEGLMGPYPFWSDYP